MRYVDGKWNFGESKRETKGGKKNMGCVSNFVSREGRIMTIF
jgi:hypothetical protein